MTIHIAGYRITLFKFERLERFTVQIDQNAVAQQADEIKQSQYFQSLQDRVREIRAIKDTEFGRQYIENLSKC